MRVVCLWSLEVHCGSPGTQPSGIRDAPQRRKQFLEIQFYWGDSPHFYNRFGVPGGPMAVVLANYLGSAPEFPRLRVLELGAGTGPA